MKKSGPCVGRAWDGFLIEGVCCYGSCHADEHCSSIYLFDCRLADLCLMLFYVHGKHLWSCRDRQLTYPYLSWAGLDLLSG